MLKADIARLTALACDDEAVRVAAADALAALPRHHFDDHDVDPERLPPDWLEAMATAWRDTSSDAVRAWVAQAVALAAPWPGKPVEPLMRDFLDTDGPSFDIVLRFVMRNASDSQVVKERILSMQRNRDPKVCEVLAGSLGGWKRDFLEVMRLPDAADMLRAVADDSPNRPAQALQALTTVTAAACRPFIGTLVEDIGTTYDGAEGHVVLTQQGWLRRS